MERRKSHRASLHLLPRRLTNLSQMTKRMLVALETNLDPTNPSHHVFELCSDPQHRLPVHCFGRPVIRATDDALHATLGACHEEADGWAFSEEKRSCHVSCEMLIRGSGMMAMGNRLTCIDESEETLITRSGRLRFLNKLCHDRIRCRVDGNAFAIRIAVMSREGTSCDL